MDHNASNTSPAIDLFQKLQQLLNSDNALSDNDEGKEIRKKACETLIPRLWLELAEPGDLIDRIVFQPLENAMLRVALDLGIYDLLVKRGTAVDSQDIAKEKGVDPVLMERIMRNLAAANHVAEVGPSRYAANKASRAFTTAKGISMATFGYEFAAPAWEKIPRFLKANGYQNPVDPMDAPLQLAFNSKEHFFPLMVKQNVLEVFQTAMSSYRTDRADFLDVFPAQERLLQDFEPLKGKLLVDVGGGHGHETLKLVDRFPEAKGQVVLQDQPDVIGQVSQTDKMELMAHDFFQPQPVKHAKAYYFRMIMHDWPDDKCIEILKNTASAMVPGYSKVLINDIVLPDQGATRFATVSDLNMLALLAAEERSEAQWRRLLEQAGLGSNIKVWPGTPESVIEAMLDTA